MPAPVSSSTPARTAITSSAQKQRTNPNKKKRIVRRRGRAPGDIASDDEIEREAATDSGSEDDLSSSPSDSDSDSEPEDAVPDGRSRPTTPNTSQSPGDRAARNKVADQPESFFAAAGNWSEMVADDEKAAESGDLPVIEFAEFDAQNLPTRPRQKKAKKHAKVPRSAPEPSSPAPQLNGVEDERTLAVEDSGGQHIASSSRIRSMDETNRRLPAHVARQAYQQRLESDPSYVPTVGGFWSHDDRLLDKELRSLSGWWRDRRGGRGRGNGFRGRGRGGFAGHNGSEEPTEDLPPIEKTWGHDGFEEMKQREEQRKASQQKAQTPPPPFQGANRGRGFVPGRGGRGGLSRGGYVNTSGRLSVTGRIWYSQKPEVSWTKQHEGFLYFELDPSLRPRQGQGQGVVVRLPGDKEAKVVRISSKARPATKPRTPDEEDVKIYTVNLPERSTKLHVSSSTQETPIEDVFKVRPSLAPKAHIPLRQPAPAVEAAVTVAPLPTEPTRESPPHLPYGPSSSRSQPEASVRSQLEQLSVDVNSLDPERVAKTEEAVMRNPASETQVEGRSTAVVEESAPAVATMYSPSMPQPSPTYASPYGYAPLPPGIAVNQHGMPYELATGRPVYLQAPPPPMYNPRPMMHSPLPPAFAPTHMPSHSHSHSLSAVSPDFLAHSSSHTPPMNGFIDPSTGNPIFSFPRQTSRVEIRAPADASEAKSLSKIPAHSSGLRLSAATFEPSRPSSNTSATGYYPTLASPEGSMLPSYAPVEGTENGVMEMQHDPTMMAYAPYPQQPYYYHDAYGYAHNPYLDMQHAQAYEMYPPQEGTVYY